MRGGGGQYTNYSIVYYSEIMIVEVELNQNRIGRRQSLRDSNRMQNRLGQIVARLLWNDTLGHGYLV